MKHKTFFKGARAGTGKVFILTGPSGVGKTTVAKRLLVAVKTLKRLVTYTTRPMRRGEKHGVAYFFISPQEFQKKLAAGEFFEHAEVYGQWYGNSAADIDADRARGQSVLLVLDIQGAQTVKKNLPSAQMIFLEPDNLAQLSKRIASRHQQDPLDLERRVATAKEEMKMKTIADFVVLNHQGKIGETVAAVKKIIFGQAATAKAVPR